METGSPTHHLHPALISLLAQSLSNQQRIMEQQTEIIYHLRNHTVSPSDVMLVRQEIDSIRSTLRYTTTAIERLAS